MINLSISNVFKKQISKEWFTDAVNATLLHEKVDPSNNDLSILIRNDDFLRKLKKQYFGINEPTDVLSFPAGDVNPETNHNYLGDIIISYTQAEKNAETSNKTTRSELMLLVVHGVLHLLGYDHADPETQKVMWEKQDVILGVLEGNKLDA
jgi:probable rRNA maturation factor